MRVSWGQITKTRMAAVSRAAPALRPFWRCTLGSSAVEAAFAFPVLLTFIFLTFEFGRVLYARGELEYAVHNAARFAMVSNGATQTDVTQNLKGQFILLDPARVSDVQLAEIRNPDNTRTSTLSVSYQVDFTVPLIAQNCVTLQRSIKFARRP